MKKRIIGIDVARALAVIGMIIVNFKVVLGDDLLFGDRKSSSPGRVTSHAGQSSRRLTG